MLLFVMMQYVLFLYVFLGNRAVQRRGLSEFLVSSILEKKFVD